MKEKEDKAEVKKSGEDKENVSQEKSSKKSEIPVSKASKEKILGSSTNTQKNVDNVDNVKTPLSSTSKNAKLSLDMNTFDAGFFKVHFRCFVLTSPFDMKKLYSSKVEICTLQPAIGYTGFIYCPPTNCRPARYRFLPWTNKVSMCRKTL